jgi:hypothetical protein
MLVTDVRKLEICIEDLAKMVRRLEGVHGANMIAGKLIRIEASLSRLMESYPEIPEGFDGMVTEAEDLKVGTIGDSINALVEKHQKNYGFMESGSLGAETARTAIEVAIYNERFIAEQVYERVSEWLDDQPRGKVIELAPSGDLEEDYPQCVLCGERYPKCYCNLDELDRDPDVIKYVAHAGVISSIVYRVYGEDPTGIKIVNEFDPTPKFKVGDLVYFEKNHLGEDAGEIAWVSKREPGRAQFYTVITAENTYEMGESALTEYDPDPRGEGPNRYPNYS